MTDLIYEYHTHSLNYENRCDLNYYSLTIGYLELMFDLDTDTLIGVQGFLPLIKAERCNIQIPEATNGTFINPRKGSVNHNKGHIYDYFLSNEEAKEYVSNAHIKFDKVNGVIEVDIYPQHKGSSIIKIDGNIICSIDDKGELQTLYIKPNRFDN